jgi:hypothetical protein
MARLVLTDAYVAYGSSDISDYITSVSLNTTFDVIETTAFGDTARKRVAGLADNSITIEFQQDFASGAIEQIIYQSQATNTLATTVYMEVRPTSASPSATNPKYTFNALVSEYPILNGAVGELATGSVTWPISGAITKAIS